MKFIKGLALLSFLLLGSCFNPPEFPVGPQIEFDRIEFIDTSEPFDSLNLYIHFKDGDGDLGLSANNKDVSDPFNDAFFYLENNGGLDTLSTVSGYLDDQEYDLLEVPHPEHGKLVTLRTREKPEYSFLPPGDKCDKTYKHYEQLDGLPDDQPSDGRRLLIEKKDLMILDTLVELVDSFPHEDPQYYQIKDLLYFTPNPDHYNIEVDFFVKDNTAPDGYREFDWREQFCTTFDGRFPVLSNKKDTSIEGTLRYSMTSIGFKELFSIKILRLRVSIKDYARHRSNVIITPDFTL